MTDVCGRNPGGTGPGKSTGRDQKKYLTGSDIRRERGFPGSESAVSAFGGVNGRHGFYRAERREEFRRFRSEVRGIYGFCPDVPGKACVHSAVPRIGKVKEERKTVYRVRGFRNGDARARAGGTPERNLRVSPVQVIQEDGFRDGHAFGAEEPGRGDECGGNRGEENGMRLRRVHETETGFRQNGFRGGSGGTRRGGINLGDGTAETDERARVGKGERMRNRRFPAAHVRARGGGNGDNAGYAGAAGGAVRRRGNIVPGKRAHGIRGNGGGQGAVPHAPEDPVKEFRRDGGGRRILPDAVSLRGDAAAERRGAGDGERARSGAHAGFRCVGSADGVLRICTECSHGMSLLSCARCRAVCLYGSVSYARLLYGKLYTRGTGRGSAGKENADRKTRAGRASGKASGKASGDAVKHRETEDIRQTAEDGRREREDGGNRQEAYGGAGRRETGETP